MSKPKFPTKTIGTPDYPVEVTLFNCPQGYDPEPGRTYDVPREEEGCPDPSCDLMADHRADGGACPYHCGNCYYCDRSDCEKSHPECDGLTYDERNESP